MSQAGNQLIAFKKKQHVEILTMRNLNERSKKNWVKTEGGKSHSYRLIELNPETTETPIQYAHIIRAIKTESDQIKCVNPLESGACV